MITLSKQTTTKTVIVQYEQKDIEWLKEQKAKARKGVPNRQRRNSHRRRRKWSGWGRNRGAAKIEKEEKMSKQYYESTSSPGTDDEANKKRANCGCGPRKKICASWWVALVLTWEFRGLWTNERGYASAWIKIVRLSVATPWEIATKQDAGWEPSTWL